MLNGEFNELFFQFITAYRVDIFWECILWYMDPDFNLLIEGLKLLFLHNHRAGDAGINQFAYFSADHLQDACVHIAAF